jgi:hypothetical protein
MACSTAQYGPVLDIHTTRHLYQKAFACAAALSMPLTHPSEQRYYVAAALGMPADTDRQSSHAVLSSGAQDATL